MRMTAGIFATRYELIEQIGDGRFGEVWRAYDQHLKVELAVKLLKAGSDEVIAYREASMLMGLEGEHILRVMNADRFRDIPYIATRLAEAGSTEDQLQTAWPAGVRFDRVVTWGRDALIGLSACHDHGLVHRDAKPANVFLDRHDRAALGDFGVAQEMGLDGKVAPGGDPQVRSPEMMKGGRGGERSDIYSIGVSLYDWSRGRGPMRIPTGRH